MTIKMIDCPICGATATFVVQTKTVYCPACDAEQERRSSVPPPPPESKRKQQATPRSSSAGPPPFIMDAAPDTTRSPRSTTSVKLVPSTHSQDVVRWGFGGAFYGYCLLHLGDSVAGGSAFLELWKGDDELIWIFIGVMLNLLFSAPAIVAGAVMGMGARHIGWVTRRPWYPWSPLLWLWKRR